MRAISAIDIALWDYSGCTKGDAPLMLGEFLREKAPHVRLVVHRDRDYLPNDLIEKFSTRLNQAGVRPFITESNDVEGYFIDAEHLHSLNPSVPLQRIQELIVQATNETADKSIEAIINQRTEEAFRQRREGGDVPNHGAIAIRARADYQSDPVKFRRGKVVLARIRALLQQELGTNPRVFFPSAHLSSDTIRAIRRDVWPHQ